MVHPADPVVCPILRPSQRKYEKKPGPAPCAPIGTAVGTGRRLSRRPSLVDLPEAAAHLPDNFHLSRAHSRPLSTPQPDQGPLGRIEGVLVPLPPLVVVGRLADVPAGRQRSVDVP